MVTLSPCWRKSAASTTRCSCIFDGSLRRPLRVDDPLAPQSVYGQSKLLGEQLLQQNAPPNWLIIRTAWLYGPGGVCFPQTILNAARAGKPLTVIDDQIGSPTFTDDLANGTLQLIERNASGIFHFANDGQTNWHDFAVAILDEFGVQTPVARTTSAQWKTQRPNSAIRPAYSVLDLSKYEAIVGHRPPAWRDALKRYHLATG
jgi:dTDP-4-dehydrorhamnose reductase